MSGQRISVMCSVPGCRAKLGEVNTSGTCHRHDHAPGWCACRLCRPRANGAEGGRRITLPVPPWERGLRGVD